ncbi:MAG: ISNCY family transposase [Myxococcota bacterium]
MDTLTIIARLAERRMTQAQAATSLQKSERQVRRLLRAFEAEGAAGLASKRRGKPASNRIPDTYRRSVLSLVRERYADFGPTLAREKLAELHDVRVAKETLRQWMIADGLWLTRDQRKKRIQQPRHRRDCYGELVQIDGCEHHWFEYRAKKCVLLVFVDDATSQLMALHMCVSESAFSYFAAARKYLAEHGKPVALYSDKAGVFRVNSKRPKAGDGYTQFGRAMSALNIDTICANTPAAKGRVERAHLTLQDRLVKELRLRGISSMEDANAYLPEFIEDYNRRFGRPPRNPHDAHRPLGARDHLDEIFTWREQRTVTGQLTLHHRRTMYILEPTDAAKKAAKKRVTVVETASGEVRIMYKGQHLKARAFHKEDRRVTQGAIVQNKLLSAALTEIQQRQAGKEEKRVRSAKAKWEKAAVRRKFADSVEFARGGDAAE